MDVSIRAATFNGFNTPIGLSVQTTGGITAQLSGTSLLPGGGVTLTLNMSRAAAGAHVVRLLGSGGGVTRTVPFFIPISIAGTIVQACSLTSDGQCDDTKTQTTTLDSNGSSTSAPYVIDNLKPGEYQMLAWKDLNNDGLINTGDLYGESSLRVSPPSSNVGVRLERLTSGKASTKRFVH
jgi:hypothetical protein